ncbi:DNA (cytosine-5-)-methyltransferase [Clostridium sp. BNL1100]|uniref:DNA cytosine methyltransferase n=1 Tax=Clostridium sp. BNL1100 TaxID=755731 RepID=UPI00024A7EFA|nr:DNA (cytosine-5-)-methyltransferase [Clostridium sp. BNL1100]AEY65395.1 DNA-methyltransferase Dcm [Clostridium sp. BNL1100]
MLTHFSTFTGIGGIDLAAEWAGFETVGQCEWADYPTKVLEKHWPNVPRWRDIRSVTAESFKEKTGLSTTTIISGGFPCQPFSNAGLRKGKEDDRYLWPEMLRVISELKPTWFIGENVAGIIDMALDQVLSDLESQGYSTQTFIIPACSQNASHRRDRVFIIANIDSSRYIHREIKKYSAKHRINAFNDTTKSISTITDIDGNRIQRSFEEKVLWQQRLPRQQGIGSVEGWVERCNEYEPKLLRNFHGVPNGMDRVKCLGNAVVPQQVYPILKAIADIERGIGRR